MRALVCRARRARSGQFWGGEASLGLFIQPISPAEGHHSVNTYKGCMKFSDCNPGFVSTTMGPKDYMVSNTHCCQGDGCNQGTISRKYLLCTISRKCLLCLASGDNQF